MKLLHVITSMDPIMGGVCQAVRTVIAGLAKNKVQNEVVSLDAQDAPFLSKASFLVHALGPAANPWSYSSKLTPWLIGNVSSFDVVIIHGLWQYHAYAANKVMNQLKIQHQANNMIKAKLPKLFIMPHGMLDPYFQHASGRKLKSIRNWIYWKLIEGKVINNADGLLFTCEAERLLARLSFKPYYPKREIVVGLGVEAPPTYSDTMQMSLIKKIPELKGRNYFLFLSRVHEKKGVDLLLQAYSKLNKKISERASDNREEDNTIPVAIDIPKLIVAGPGLETTYGKKVQKLVAEDSALRENVYFPGMLSDSIKWGAFYGCEAFVLPSHQENYGIAVVEALACAKPVLISNQVNIWREIKAEDGGLVAEDTLKGTYELIKNWKSMSHDEKTVMGQNARRAFEKHFDIGSATRRLLQAIS